uniref:Uncharacterized protein n=1 Tax=Arundo donax TaxID=35708 RepID=A0A0A8YAR4_ARUDO
MEACWPLSSTAGACDAVEALRAQPTSLAHRDVDHDKAKLHLETPL